jgi:hypothetical protein
MGTVTLKIEEHKIGCHYFYLLSSSRGKTILLDEDDMLMLYDESGEISSRIIQRRAQREIEHEKLVVDPVKKEDDLIEKQYRK